MVTEQAASEGLLCDANLLVTQKSGTTDAMRRFECYYICGATNVVEYLSCPHTRDSCQFIVEEVCWQGYKIHSTAPIESKETHYGRKEKRVQEMPEIDEEILGQRRAPT